MLKSSTIADEQAWQNLIPDMEAWNQVRNACGKNPHAFLGMHHGPGGKGILVRVFDPEAQSVTLLIGDERYEMTSFYKDGLFQIWFPDAEKHFNYKLERNYDRGTFISEDPYHFLPALGDMDVYLFNQGEHHRVYDVMGAHIRHYNDQTGVDFAVWAPNAERVSVVGTFNCWDGRRHQMRLLGSSGIWEIFIPGVAPGDLYKFEIRTKAGNFLLKTDPYARQMELRPGTASVVVSDRKFVWHDAEWMENRKKRPALNSPMNIYEVHLGSWGGPGCPAADYSRPDGLPNYRQLALALADYVKKMNYTHVELLPICEHPLDESWGYQVTGFFAPTSRYGTQEDFAYFIDCLHQNGIGVILDWVPAHFPKDSFSLGRFDGTALYEHEDPRQGEQKDWGTYVFNFGRNEVRNFLIGSALYWLKEFHADGLRVDAVASMLYLDYSRKEGEWIPNQYGGNENLEAISFLKRLNELAHGEQPGCVMIAEESTAWPGVSRPVYLGGLGFTFKWNMGWMHDSLEYFEEDPLYRSYHHGKVTFSLTYAFSENFILPLSHDEVVHGKRSLVSKMPGPYEQKFANLRALYSLMTAHPGKKLLFMGGEFAQMIEWNCRQALDWNLLDFPIHKGMQTMVRDLNKFYLDQPALWEQDCIPAGFQWIDGSDYRQSVLSFCRWDKARKAPVLVILNFTPQVYENFCVGVPAAGVWREAFNSDRQEYGGTGLLNEMPLPAREGKCHGQDQFVSLRLPWLGAVMLVLEHAGAGERAGKEE